MKPNHPTCRSLLCLLVAASALSAQPGQSTAPAAMLSLDDAILLSLQNNYTVRIGNLEVDRAEAAVALAGEQFETVGSIGMEKFRDDLQGPDGASRIEGDRQSVEVQKRFVTGTEVTVGVYAEDVDGLPNRTEASISVLQPLLRGRGLAANRAPIRIANRQLDLSREALRQHVIDTLSAVHFAYLDALLADENVRVAEESLELSSQLFRENRRRAEVGSIATSDLLQAEAEVAAREEQMHQAVLMQTEARNQLKQLLSDGGMELLDWQISLQQLPPPEQRSVHLSADYRRALQQRPDYRDATILLDINRIEQLRLSNQALPSLDLYARMSMSGYGRSLSDSFSNLADDRHPAGAVGLRLSRSFSNRASEARAAINSIDERALSWSLRELEQAILFDLDNAAAAIEQNWKRLQSAQRGRRLAEQSLQAEERRYETGTSSTFILIRLQTDLVNARIRELVAATDYRKALVNYDRQTAELLELHAIHL